MNSIIMINKYTFNNYRTLSLLSSNYHHLSHKLANKETKISKKDFRQTVFRNFSYSEFYISIAQSNPVQSLQHLLVDLHNSLHLPWWSIIFLSTLGIRACIVFPLAVHQNQVISRLANIQAEIHKLVPELNKEVNIAKVKYKWDETYAKKFFKIQLRRLHNKFVIRDNCHPMKTFLLGIIQVPVWIMLSFSLRNLTMIANSEYAPADIATLKSEGAMWFPDLTSPDSIFIPLMFLAVNLTLTELHVLRRMGKGNFLQSFLLHSSRVIIVVVAAAATINPTSVTFYWLCSSSFGLAQSVLLMHPKVKRALGIPAMPKESLTPYADIAKNFRKRFLKSSS